MCPRKYALSYVYGLEPEFRSTALLLGSAVHGAIGWFFTEKLEGRAPTRARAEEVLAADLLAGAAGAQVRWKDATPESLEYEGRRFLRLYLERFGDLPVTAVEAPFGVELLDQESGEVLGRPLKGYFDLVLGDGRTVEVKTSARGWSEHDLSRHFQVGAYCYAGSADSGAPALLEVHVIVKLKREPRVDVFPVKRDQEACRWWFRAAAAIEHAIAQRAFPPAPGPLCRECEYEATCAGWTSTEPADIAHRRLPVLQREPLLSLSL
jgi:CRISPR/Cas system-associated exonuclease Cas4 (RecB family)